MFASLETSEHRIDPERAEIMVRAMTYLVVLGVTAGFCWAYFEGAYRGLPFPYNTFLFKPGDHWGDLYHSFPYLRADNPYVWGNLPPFTYIILKPFSWFGISSAVALWSALVIGGLGSFVAWELSFIRQRIDRTAAIVVLTVVTYPFMFAIDRGNFEVFVVLAVAACVWALQTDRPTLAAVAVGTAAALKGYPLIFIALFLVRKQWRLVAISIATTAVLTFFGSIYYNFNLLRVVRVLIPHLNQYTSAFVIGNLGIEWGSSLFSLVKIFSFHILGGDTNTVTQLLHIYMAVAAAAVVGIVAALWRLPLYFWEQITLLVLALVTLPPVSADYCLLHLVVPLMLFLRYGADARRRWWYLAGFASLMVPKAYVLLFPSIGPPINLGVVLDPLVMLTMGLGIIVAGLTRRRAVKRTAAVLL